MAVKPLQTINLKTESDFWSATQERKDQAPLIAPQVDLDPGLILQEQWTNYLQQYLAIYFPVSKNSHWSIPFLFTTCIGTKQGMNNCRPGLFSLVNTNWFRRAHTSHFGSTRASIYLYKENDKQLISKSQSLLTLSH